MALSEDQKAMLRLLARSERGYDDIASLTGSSIDEVRARVNSAIAALEQSPSADQKAMLRLLAQREEGYDDIAALTGSSVDDVRTKVRDALAGLEEGGAVEVERRPPPAAAPPPPPSEAPAPPPPPAPAEKAEPAPRSQPKPKPRPTPSALPALKLPQDKGALRALAAGAAAVIVIVLLLVTGVLGGGDGGSDSTTAGTPPSSEAEPPAGGEKTPTQAVLEPVGGLDAGGRALFGRDGRAVVLLLRADGLPPSPRGRSYTVSLVRSAEQRLPLIATKVAKDGVINGRFQVAAQVLGLLAAGFDQMEVSLVDDATLRVALAQAQKEGKAPAYGGATVLRGDVTGPIVAGAEDEG